MDGLVFFYFIIALKKKKEKKQYTYYILQISAIRHHQVSWVSQGEAPKTHLKKKLKI